MKIKVIEPFEDKYKPLVMYVKGTILDVDDKRAKDLIDRKLAEAVEEKGKGKKVKKEG